jgi:hypothetical protein
VPRDELCDRVLVRALTTGGGQAVQDGGFGCSRSGSARTRLGGFFRRDFDSGFGIGDGLLIRRPPTSTGFAPTALTATYPSEEPVPL